MSTNKTKHKTKPNSHLCQKDGLKKIKSTIEANENVQHKKEIRERLLIMARIIIFGAPEENNSFRFTFLLLSCEYNSKLLKIFVYKTYSMK